MSCGSLQRRIFIICLSIIGCAVEGLLTHQNYTVRVTSNAPTIAPNVFIVNPGDNFTVICTLLNNGDELGEELYGCEFTSTSWPGKIRPSKRKQGNITYAGRGMDQGDCGVQITKVEFKHNGSIVCHLKSHLFMKYNNHMALTVTNGPSPTDIQVSNITQNSVHLKWNYNHTIAAQSFVIAYKPKNTSQELWETTNTIADLYFTLTSLCSDTEYEMYVMAVINENKSELSPPVTVKTKLIESNDSEGPSTTQSVSTTDSGVPSTTQSVSTTYSQGPSTTQSVSTTDSGRPDTLKTPQSAHTVVTAILVSGGCVLVALAAMCVLLRYRGLTIGRHRFEISEHWCFSEHGSAEPRPTPKRCFSEHESAKPHQYPMQSYR